MAKRKQKLMSAECGRKVDVTRTGNVYEEPVYCAESRQRKLKVFPRFLGFNE